MKRFVCAALLLLSSICHAEPASTFSEKIKDKQVNVYLPINWTEKNSINLAVSVPYGYKPLQPPEEWQEAVIIEFIPKEETAEQWTEIITLIKILGKKVSSSFLSDMLKTGFKTVDENLSVWLDKKDQTADYEISELGISYQNSGVLEVFGSENYSGPVDCVGVQYTIRPKAGKEEESVEKIKAFLKNNVKVLDTKDSQKSDTLTQ